MNLNKLNNHNLVRYSIKTMLHLYAFTRKRLQNYCFFLTYANFSSKTCCNSEKNNKITSLFQMDN